MIERENETLWVEKYRPHNIDECILPKRTKDIFKGFIENKEIPNLILQSRTPGTGKAQPLTSNLLTPNGWVRMGDAYVGMPIINGNGNTTKITGVYPQGVRDTYRITFNDRSSIEVSDEHLNAVFMHIRNGVDKEFVVTTNELIGLHKKYGKKLKVRVPKINFEKKDLALDPYFVGLMIGDGSLSGNFGFSNSESDIVDSVARYVSTYGCVIKQNQKAPCDYRIVSGKERNCSIALKRIMENYGMMCKSVDKRIPIEYLFSTYEDRLELLRGLYDTDGTIDVSYIHKKGKEYHSICYEFTTSSKGLSDDFAFLVRSLGIVDTVSVHKAGYRDSEGNYIKCNDSYRHCLKVPKGLKIFKSFKHSKRWKERMYEPVRSIVNIEYIGRKECQCIMVESDDHCYITDNVTVTHNTTVAKAICEELGYEVLFINASLENGIDVLRNKIANFASTVSFFSSKKCVILDEADALNPNSIQPALRGFIEQFSQSVRFIFTCNYVNKLLPPIVSRCTVVDFNVPNNEKKDLLKQSLERLEYILTNEGVTYDRKTVAKMLLSHYPDMRRTINELQRYSAGGEIDDGIMVNMNHDNFNQLVKFLREKNFKDMRLWVANNKDIEPEKIFSFFFENANKFMKPESVPQLIIMTDRYQYMGAFVVDQEINTTAYLTEVMANCEFTRPE